MKTKKKDDTITSRVPAQPRLPGVAVGSVIPKAAIAEDDSGKIARFARSHVNKYKTLGVLGEGGMGRVLKVYDSDLDRVVAMKILRPDVARNPSSLKHFIQEARYTGRLEHPNIVPLYEVGRTRSGQLYYTMRYVQGDSLAAVLRRLEEGNEHAVKRFSLTWLVQVFSQVCMAVHYAHSMGYVHRDLKPGNIMIGEYGEVQVTDWGLASSLAESRPAHGMGQIAGTPAYMSPEQTLGDSKLIDSRSDVYSLGVVLYQILTRRLPFKGTDLPDIIERIRHDRPAPIRATDPARPIPPMLARIALKCLAKTRERRYQTARDLNDAIQEYLEGEREQARNLERADQKVAQAMPLIKAYFELRKEIARLKNDLTRQRARLPAWETVEGLRSILDLETLLGRKSDEKAEMFGQVTDLLYDALAILDGHEEARRALARMYWVRFTDAEAEQNHKQMLEHKRMVERFHSGSLNRELVGHGSLKIDSEPAGAEVTLARYEQVDVVVKPGERASLGRTPIPPFELPMGSYELRIEREGCDDTVFPVRVERNQEWDFCCKLPGSGAIPPGFVYVPAGRFLYGGDSGAVHSTEATFPDVEGFLIMQFPVTFADYIEFLSELAVTDREEFKERLPRNTQAEPFVATVDGRLAPVNPDRGVRITPEFPVFGVSWHDANAYAVWKSAQTGLALKLPREIQWEKAARGTDGRIYPWGDRHLYCLCKNMLSRPGDPYPERIGSFPTDISPYGVRDLAGGVHDWCDDPYEKGMRQRAVRGGSWAYSGLFARCASRHWNAPEDRRPYVGFRLCVSPFP